MWKIGNLLLRQSNSTEYERWQDILAKRERDIGSLHMFLQAREQQLKTAKETIQSLDHQLLEAGAHIAALEQSIELLKRKVAEAGASVPEKELQAVYVQTYNTKAR